MSRCAILPYPGDPFLLQYWLRNFYNEWADKIDKLYIICNTPVEGDVVDYITEICTNDKIDFTYIDHHIQHGDAIRLGLEKATEDYVVLVEDDAYILKGKGEIINTCFNLIESGQYELVGSKRGSCHQEILTAARDKYSIAYEGEGDQGPNFWPNYLFIKRLTLLATDRDYNSRAWFAGDVIHLLNDYVVAAPVISSDTFVWASIQLRAMIPESKICYMPQYHAHPDDYKHYTEGKYLFDGRAPWTHIGSLSSGASGVIMDDQGRSIAKRFIEPPHGPTILPPEWCDVTSEFAKMEWERRVQMWLTFYEQRDLLEIQAFAELYRLGLERIIDQYQLRAKRIKQRQEVYKLLGL